MNKYYHVSFKMNTELYEKYKSLLKEKNITSFGRYATISKLNSIIFSTALTDLINGDLHIEDFIEQEEINV